MLGLLRLWLGESAGCRLIEAVVVAVPARLTSQRLPGKVLADIAGKPMLRHVLERCAGVQGVAALLVCSDSHQVLEAVRSWRFQAMATVATCGSGSERIASVIDALVRAGGAPPANTLVINVQADQPLLDPCILETMIALATRPDRDSPSVLTPVYQLSPARIHDPNVVKVVRTVTGRAVMFSRSALPHVRDVPPDRWHTYTTYWGHVGIYGYRADVLASWPDLPVSPLEQLEKLEQLRLLEAGIPITTFEVAGDCGSVDTEEQLIRVRRQLGSQL